MQDTTIKPGHYAYQIRIDILDKKCDRIFTCHEDFSMDEAKERICYYKKQLETMLEVHFSYYFIFIENGYDTGKLHLQGVIWSQHNYTNKFVNKLKGKYFFSNRATKNSISLTTAKRITNLCSYVSKDGDSFLNNLTDEEISKFPTWKKKDKQTKKEFKQQLIEKIKKEVEQGETKYNIAKMIIEEYWENSMRQPARMDLIKYLGIYHPDYTAEDYIDNLGIFRHPHTNYY